MSEADRCACCGSIIPEGSHVCPNCKVATKRDDGMDAYAYLAKYMKEVKPKKETAKKPRLIDANALLAEYDRVHIGKPGKARKLIADAPTINAVEVVHGRWEDGACSNCKNEALSTSWDEPIYDYDWEENLRYSYTETHTEYHLTDYCPNCGAKMDGDGNE